MNLNTWIFATLVSFSMLVFYGCTDDEGVGTVEINIKLEYENQALVTLDEYSYPQDFKLFFTKFSVYLSELELMNESNTIELKDVVFLNLTENQMDLASAQMGSSVRIENVPSGEYDQFHLSLGVPASLNSMQPSDFGPDHPLSNTGEFWEGWSSYIFHKTEGRMDLDGDGEFESPIALHIGSDAAFREKIMNKNISVKKDETTVLEFTIDVKEMYDLGSTPYDLKNTPQIHHLSQLPSALPLMDNLIDAFQ